MCKTKVPAKKRPRGRPRGKKPKTNNASSTHANNRAPEPTEEPLIPEAEEQVQGESPSPNLLPPAAPSSSTGRPDQGTDHDTDGAGRSEHQSEPGVGPVPGLDPGLLEPVVRLPFDVWARARHCPALALTDSEARALCQTLVPVLVKWFPDPTRWAEELALVLVLGPVLMMKMQRASELEIRVEEPAKATTADDEDDDDREGSLPGSDEPSEFEAADG